MYFFRPVRIVNPLKQGLKHNTHIWMQINHPVRIVNPLKQGLKPKTDIRCDSKSIAVRIVNPLKQGLKLF